MCYVTHFSLVKFLSFISSDIFRHMCFNNIFGSLPFNSLVLPKIITFVTFKSLSSFSSRLA